MVVAPWRRLVQAARWKGQAPQTTTGVARTSETHCQPVNCSAGTIASSTTGTVSSGRDDQPAAQGGQLVARRSVPGSAGIRLGQRGGVPAGRDGGEQVVGAERRGVAHGGLLGGVVDAWR